MDLLITTLVLFFVVEFTRALPWPARWKQRKPFSCHACMVGWWSLLGQLVLGKVMPPLFLLGAAGGTLLLLRLVERVETPPDFGSGETVGPPTS